ncbi:unnamed protein product [Cyprideis torosa]|uniref:Uncharacterized protein n=1 Tax=Cyprideis torosa TaxID=163714 RepID=A0A7R8WL56_9CRUS|nr:unnamed protein product [Cyprideis torosa]CAG0903978.1 unnamed protein product [Cyprideis torosa]
MTSQGALLVTSKNLSEETQAVWRKVQEQGLRQKYITDETIRTILKSLPALAFLPVESVSHGFEQIVDEMDGFEDEETQNQMRSGFDYFEDTYIYWAHRSQRTTASAGVSNADSPLHMMAAADEDQNISCDICFELFTTEADHRPMVICSNGHNLCFSCSA